MAKRPIKYVKSADRGLSTRDGPPPRPLRQARPLLLGLPRRALRRARPDRHGPLASARPCARPRGSQRPRRVASRSAADRRLWQPGPVGEVRRHEQDKGKALPGKSTLNRLELGAAQGGKYPKINADPAAIHDLLIDECVRAIPPRSRVIVLDFDATDDPIHGPQEGREEPGSWRGFAEFQYRTKDSWSRERRVIGKAEITGDKDNPRFIVTDLTGEEEWAKDLPALASGRGLYEKFYCARGDMENRIKEQRLDLFADRSSTAPFASTQLRLWFYTFAYLLLARLRATALQGTVLAKATVGTKPLYGHQRGAEIGYNPQKPGRPSHVSQNYFVVIEPSEPSDFGGDSPDVHPPDKRPVGERLGKVAVE